MSRPNHQQEHCGSYYAATLNNTSTYPAISESLSVDVCVIGGGFTGVSTALTLAERGHRVALVEANRIGWGASGRNGGQLIYGFSGASRIVKQYGESIAPRVREMEWRGNEIIRERIEKYAIDCDLKDGYMEVARNEQQMRILEEDFREYQDSDFKHGVKLLDKSELQSTIGTDRYLGGLLNYGNGHLHPLNLCRGEAQAALDLGVKVFEQSPVIDIRHGTPNKVILENAQISAKYVVLAGNAYHRLERKSLGGLLFPANSYIIATQPLEQSTIDRINPLDVAICDMNNVPDYYRLSPDKRMLFGGVSNYSGRELRDIKACLLPRMLRLYPELEDARIDYEWGGTMGIIVRRVVLMGRISDTVFFSQGYSGHGVSATHMAGEVLADAVEGKFERLELFENIRHFPIPLGDFLGRNLVALGMLYYKLLDNI